MKIAAWRCSLADGIFLLPTVAYMRDPFDKSVVFGWFNLRLAIYTSTENGQNGR